MQRDLSGRWLLLIALFLFCAGVLIDRPWRGFDPSQRVLIQGEAQHVAESLLRDGTFANPFQRGATGPTAHVAPVFPFVTFLLLKAFGMGAGGWLGIRCLPVIALSLQYALLPYAARLLGYNAWVGVIASAWGVILKPLREDLWEAHLAGLAGLLLTMALCWWISRGRSSRGAAAVGLFAGIVFLLQPVMALVYYAWIAWDAWVQRRMVRSMLLATMLPVLVCLPWAIRNAQVVGYFGLRDNLGTELYASFEDCAVYGLRVSEFRPCFQLYHPDRRPEENAAVRAMGEAAYNRDRLQKALMWIGEHPVRTASLTAQRLWFFWFPSENYWQGYVEQRRLLLFHLVTIAGLAGLTMSVKRRVPFAWMMMAWTVLFPLIYYMVNFEMRYRYPILWITWLEAAYGAVLAMEALRGGRKMEST